MLLFINRVKSHNERHSERHSENHCERVDTYDVPDEYMHCFNALDDIPEYDPMEVEKTKDLYEATEFEWHHWKEPGINERLPEPKVKKPLNLKSYQVYRQILENNQPEAEAQIIVEIENGLKQRKKKAPAKVRGAYRSYLPEQVQELLDLVIE